MTATSATRIAAIYDIHGNLPALEAALAEIENGAVDLIVVGGDVAWGPLPRDTIERLEDLGDTAFFIRGNADREVATRADEGDGLDSVVADINRWCWEQLDERQRNWLAELQESVTIDISGVGAVLFCHGSPRNDEEMLTAGTPPDRLDAALRGVEANTIVCGHTHMQFDLKVGDKRLVNAGSVGLPYEMEPGAYWALIGPDVALRRTGYDVDAAAARMSGTGCPHVEMVFLDTLRRPTPQADVIKRFEAVAAKRDY